MVTCICLNLNAISLTNSMLSSAIMSLGFYWFVAWILGLMCACRGFGLVCACLGFGLVVLACLGLVCAC